MTLLPGMCRLCTTRAVFGRPVRHWSCARLLWVKIHYQGEPVYSERSYL